MEGKINMGDALESELWEGQDGATPSTSTGSTWGKGKTAEYYREYRARKRREQERELLDTMINNPTLPILDSSINVIGSRPRKRKTPAEYQREYRARQKAKRNGQLADSAPGHWNKLLELPPEAQRDQGKTNSGQWRTRPDAMPGLHTLANSAVSTLVSSCDVKACRVCFATDCHLYTIADNKRLIRAYQSLIGFVSDNEAKLPPYLCAVCRHRVLSCARFRAVILRAQLLMLDLIAKHQCITLEAIKSVKNNQKNSSNLSVTHKTDHYDLDIVHVKKEIYTHESVKTECANDIEPPNDMLVLEITNDETVNKYNQIESLHEETVLDDLKIEVVNDNDGDDGDLKGDDGDKRDDGMTCINPVVVYIKTEPLVYENSDGASDEDSLANLRGTENSPVSEKSDEYSSNGDEIRGAGTLGEDPPSTDRQPRAVKEEAKLSSIKLEQFTPRSGQRQPQLKTVEQKLCHLVPRPSVNTNRSDNSQSGEKPYSCDVCRKSFEHKGNLRKHMRIHSSVKPFSCNVCEKSFVIKSKLQRHVLTHSRRKRFVCELCNQIFLSESNLFIHLRIHSGEKPFSCDICSAAYKDRRDLRKHVKKHSGVKPFSCETCNKSFIIKNKLMRHLKIHSNDKPFSCEVCKKSFRDKSNLQKHSKKHTGVRPYSCDICKKSFTENAVLKGHLRIHTGEKPYACNICERSFSTRSNFKVHLDRHSVEKPYSCTVNKTEPE